MRDVGDPVLVELDDDAAPAPQDDSAAGWRPRRTVLLVVAVLVVLVVAQLVADARERARVAALTRAPGVLAALPAAPDVAWHLHDDATGDVHAAGALVLEERIAPDGSMSLAARDAGSGAERWATGLLDAADPALPPGTARYGQQCADGPGLPGLVVCLVHDATDARRPGGGAGGGAAAPGVPATAAGLVVVEAADGAVVDRYAAGADGTVAAAVGVVGDVVVLAAPLDDGMTVWALDPGSGAERWRVRADTGFGGGWLRWGAEVRVVPVGEDAVAVLGAGAALLDVADGSTLATAGTLATVVGARRDGSALVVGSEGYTRLVGPAQEVRLDGAPVPVLVDDGSVPGLALTTWDGLRAWDAATGAPRWRAVVPAHVGLVLGGLLHVHDGSRVTTLDARTGEVLRETTAAALTSDDATVTGLATDGARLLVLGSHGTPPRSWITALDPVDGVVAWHTALPQLGAISSVEAVDGVLLGATQQDTVVLR